MNIAPYKVGIILINPKDEKQCKVANELYEKLNDIGIDTILDDRNERPGVKFNDMDLIGTPIRITVGKKVEEDIIELKKRNEEEVKVIPIKGLIEELMKMGAKRD